MVMMVLEGVRKDEIVGGDEKYLVLSLAFGEKKAAGPLDFGSGIRAN